jgi:hypothetical protein
MDGIEEERLDLVGTIEAKEAGVAELTALYERIESVYVDASHTLFDQFPTTISNSANPKR